MRRNGGYVRSSLGGRSVLVGWQAGPAGRQMKMLLFMKFSKSYNLASNAYFQCAYIFGIDSMQYTNRYMARFCITRLFFRCIFWKPYR